LPQFCNDTSSPLFCRRRRRGVVVTSSTTQSAQLGSLFISGLPDQEVSVLLPVSDLLLLLEMTVSNPCNSCNRIWRMMDLEMEKKRKNSTLLYIENPLQFGCAFLLPPLHSHRCSSIGT
jgi:hypothetical protein